MNKVTHWFAIFSLTLLTAWSGNSLAAAGKVLFVFGDAGIEENGVKKKLRRGQSIENGAQLYTGPRGRMHVRMTDSTMISLRPGTEFQVEDYKYGKSSASAPSNTSQSTTAATSSGSDRSIYRLLRGGFRTITGLIGKNNKSAYQVKTPVATIGIRGTLFSARYCKGDCGRGGRRGRGGPRNGLYVGCGDGAVSLKTKGGDLDVGNDEYGFVGGDSEEPELLLEPPEVLEDDATADSEGDSAEETETAEGPVGEDEQTDEQQNEEGETEIADNTEPAEQEEQGGEEEYVELDSESEEIADRRGEVNELNNGAPDDAGVQGDSSEQTLATIDDDNDGFQSEDQQNAEAGNEPVAPVNQRDVAFATGPINPDAFTGVERSNEETIQSDGSGRLTQFVNDSAVNSGELATFDIGSAANLPEGQDPANPPIGFDSTTEISWGRWGASGAGGIATITEADGTVSDLDLGAQSLHWVAGPGSNEAPAIPQTGSINYTLIGNTDPTDSAGHVGVLGSATLNVDFTNNFVESSLAIGFDQTGQNWSASGSGDIGPGGLQPHQFEGLYSVTVSGSVSASGTGQFSGFMTENARGAGLGYSLTADLGPSTGPSEVNTVSGVAVFENPNQ